jgi:hypothetical protein
MTKIELSSFIADTDGRIDYDRLINLVSVLGFTFGVFVVALAMAGVIAANEYLTWGAGILVAPLTAKGILHGARGAVTAARGAAERRTTRAIISGEAPGRRAVDRTGSGDSPEAVP